MLGVFNARCLSPTPTDILLLRITCMCCRYNQKLEDENRRLAEEEADLDERLRSLGIVVAPSNNGSRPNLNQSQPNDELQGFEAELAELEMEIEYAQMELDDIIEMVS